MTTDREQLISLRNQINTHVADNPYPTLPEGLVIKLPDNPEGTPKGHFNGWVWSMPNWNGEPPVVSDGFNRYAVGEPGDDDYRRQHLGVDCAYKNEEAQEPFIPEWSKWFNCPSDMIPMLAMGPGHIWYADETDQGWTVKIDHHAWCGFPLISYYTHMSELFIETWTHEGGGIGGGQYVYAGFQLGFVGNSPKNDDDINHSHTELLDYSEGVQPGRENRCLNPEEYLPHFGQVVLQAA
jgi:hypothetical protein